MPVHAELTLSPGGQRYTHTLSSLLEASASHFLRGWRSEAIVLHRAVPTDLAHVQETLVDEPADGNNPAGADCYRVRVAQRNGQWAWSSAIWVAS